MPERAANRRWLTAPSGPWPWALALLAWLAGVALQLQQAQLWPRPWMQAAVLAALACLALIGLQAMRRAWPRHGWLPACAALALLGFGSTAWRADVRLAQRLDAALQGQDLLVTGVVADLPQSGPAGWRFTFTVESARHASAAFDRPVPLPPQLALGWYDAAYDEPDAAGSRVDLRAGQRWRLPLRLKQPHATLNPEGFDAELWWFEQGVAATGAVRTGRGAPAPVLLGSGVAHPVAQARQDIRDGIYRQVAEPRLAGVLAALVVGDQSAIDREDWELFRQTGIAHLVAISGVHITMLAWLAGAGVARLWRLGPRLMLWLPAPDAGRWAGLLVAAGYALLAGWGVPAQRTVLMLAAAVLLRQQARQWPWLLVLLAAAVVVTLADPWALLQAGFWLSFAAVGLLLMSSPARGGPPAPGADAGLPARLLHGLRGHGHAQLVATVGLAPLSLLFFQQLSLVGLLANLVAIPLVTLLVTPLALAGVLLAPLWSVAAALVQAGVAALGLLAQWPAAVWTAAAAPPAAVLCGLGAAVLAVLPLPLRLRLLALPLALPLLAPVVPRPAAGQFELLAADVGQGTAVLVRTRSHLLVYDAGPQYSPESDAGQRVLLPLLRARGERRIDLLMLSHRDTDHVGGAARLLAALPVQAMSSSLADDHPLRRASVPHTRCQAGQQWQWDGVRFDVLHPTPDDYPRARKPNELSCVLRITDVDGRAALLTGDIEAAQEAALLQRLGPTGLGASVLLVPHHGSRTSSTAAFLDAVAPRHAVVQAAYLSRFGHPAPDVLARYQQRRIMLVRSDQCGAWLWHAGASHCTRHVRRRYWHWQPPAPAPLNQPTVGAVVANPDATTSTAR